MDEKKHERFTKAELKRIYQMVDIDKFFDHYRARIVHTIGNEIRMCCILPNHKDSSPSANFNTEKALYNCFVCGGMGFFKLVQELEGFSSFAESVNHVKKMVGYDENQELTYIDVLLEELKDIQTEEDDDEEPEFLEVNLSLHTEFEDAMNHFSIVKKRVSKRMIELWDLKYAVSGYYRERLVIPIKLKSKVMSFAARDMSGRANKWLSTLAQAKKDKLTVTELAELREKYECKKILYPPILDKYDETKKNIIYATAIKYLLFNLDMALERTKDYVIIVEGVFDAMRLFIWGYNAVALLGTKLSKYNRSMLLANFDRLYIALDNDIKDNGDNPGQEAAAKIIESIQGEIEVFNILLPPGKDPDDCTKDEFQLCFEMSTQ